MLYSNIVQQAVRNLHKQPLPEWLECCTVVAGSSLNIIVIATISSDCRIQQLHFEISNTLAQLKELELKEQ